MALKDVDRLVTQLNSLLEKYPQPSELGARGRLGQLSDRVRRYRDCAREVLKLEYAAEPSAADVNGLVEQMFESRKRNRESQPMNRAYLDDSDLEDGWYPEEESEVKERQTGGGQRILRKPGPMGG